jgi:hypothetical protein
MSILVAFVMNVLVAFIVGDRESGYESDMDYWIDLILGFAFQKLVFESEISPIYYFLK